MGKFTQLIHNNDKENGRACFKSSSVISKADTSLIDIILNYLLLKMYEYITSPLNQLFFCSRSLFVSPPTLFVYLLNPKVKLNKFEKLRSNIIVLLCNLTTALWLLGKATHWEFNTIFDCIPLKLYTFRYLNTRHSIEITVFFTPGIIPEFDRKYWNVDVMWYDNNGRPYRCYRFTSHNIIYFNFCEQTPVYIPGVKRGHRRNLYTSVKFEKFFSN